MNPTLMQVVLDCAAFLELSSDAIVDPDSACTMMESMAYSLQKLSTTERKELTQFAKSVAKQQGTDVRGQERREFFESFGTAFGIE